MVECLPSQLVQYFVHPPLFTHRRVRVKMIYVSPKIIQVSPRAYSSTLIPWPARSQQLTWFCISCIASLLQHHRKTKSASAMMLSASLRKIIKSMVRNLEKNLRKSYVILLESGGSCKIPEHLPEINMDTLPETNIVPKNGGNPIGISFCRGPPFSEASC